MNTKSLQTFAISLIPILTFGAILTMPAFISMLKTSYGLSDAALGRLASVEYLICISGTYVTNGISAQTLSRWIPWTCIASCLIDLAAFSLSSLISPIWYQPVAALGAGICYGYALKVINLSGRPERFFGLFMAVFNLGMLGEFQLITFTTARYSANSLFVIYAILAGMALLVSLFTKLSRAPSDVAAITNNATLTPRPAAAVVVSVLSMGLCYVAYGMIWPFVQVMGISRGFAAQEVANALSMYAITAILGGLAAGALPPTLNRHLLFGGALCVLLTSMPLMYLAPSPIGFLLGCALFGLYWNFYLTLHVGVISRGDPTGRGIVFCGMAPSLGVIFGSFLGGMIIQGNDYLPLAKIGGLLVLIGVGVAQLSMRVMKRQPTARTVAAV
jgi:hypothetical protein